MEEIKHETEIKQTRQIYTEPTRNFRNETQSCNKTSVDGIKFSLGAIEEQISKFVYNYGIHQ